MTCKMRSRNPSHCTSMFCTKMVNNFYQVGVLKPCKIVRGLAEIVMVQMSMIVVSVETPCGLVCRHQRFGEIYCLHLQKWRWRQYVPPKDWYVHSCFREWCDHNLDLNGKYVHWYILWLFKVSSVEFHESTPKKATTDTLQRWFCAKCTITYKQLVFFH